MARVDAGHRRRREQVPGQALALQPPRAHQLHRRAAAAPHPAGSLRRFASPSSVPARNEAGNIEQIFARTPEMGGGTELIFVEGHSRTTRIEAIEARDRSAPRAPDAIVSGRTGKGKGDAVRWVRARRPATS